MECPVFLKFLLNVLFFFGNMMQHAPLPTLYSSRISFAIDFSGARIAPVTIPKVLKDQTSTSLLTEDESKVAVEGILPQRSTVHTKASCLLTPICHSTEVAVRAWGWLL